MSNLSLRIIMVAVTGFATWISPAPVLAANSEIDRLIDNGGYLLQKNGKTIAGLNTYTQYVPASITKIATSLAALTILGPEFRFTTAFYLDQDNNLLVKGHGDPFLISEEIGLIIDNLQDLGITGCHNLILDTSAFELISPADGAGDSLNPYDVDNSALAVNFNTINIKVDTRGRVSSAEAQTPTLPIMKRLGQNLAAGTQRINICNNPEASLQHVGELMIAKGGEKKWPVTGIIRPGRIPLAAKPIYVHQSSRTLNEIIAAEMRYSNNFIANQIFLVMGASVAGYPATWAKSRQAVTDFLHDRLQLDALSIQLMEGSGLSRRNHLTPAAMIRILNEFRPYSDLLPRDNDRLIKSGTLRGVYSFAGYFSGPDDLSPFVIMLNQEKNTRKQIVDRLAEIYKTAITEP